MGTASQRVELIHTPDYEQIKSDFLHELTLATQGKSSSIAFLKHHLSEKPLVTHGIVQGIVIGGTNYILSTEEIKSDGTRTILKRKKGVLPIIKDAQTFFSFLDKHFDSRTQAIGINFGFPMKPDIGSLGELDGTPLYAVKEHTMTDLIGKTIGKEAKRIFKAKFGRDIPISVANDTICLTLSGDGSEQGAFIAGTGFNMGLAIKKGNKKYLVNLEAGNFNKFEPSEHLKKIDAESENPGIHVFEKIVSGKYLAMYFNERINKSHPEISPIRTSQELSELSHANHTGVAGDLARAIITRSAFLVGAAIAAVFEFNSKIPSPLMGEGQGEDGKVEPQTFTLIGEGSLLWNGWHYQENIQKQLLKLGVPEDAITLKHIPNSSINGAIGLLTK
jgi:hexokinase